MKKKDIITSDLKREILELLYRDEMYNAILIELIQNNTDNLGEIYINETKNGITEVLHIKNDGNSNFTNFAYTSADGLKNIAFKIRELNSKKTLLAGKFEDVKSLFRILDCNKTITSNIFYKLNIEKYKDIHRKYKSKIRLTSLNNEDIDKVKEFTVNFLEAKTEEEIIEVTNDEKILAKIKKGVYLLDYENNPIGMARFVGKTDNFSEITSVYIDEEYRSRGFGKELIGHMIDIAIEEQRTPVLATSITNIPARKVYESMGFERQGEYAYEFL